MNEMLEEAYKVMFTEYGDVVTPKELAKMLGIGTVSYTHLTLPTTS